MRGAHTLGLESGYKLKKKKNRTCFQNGAADRDSVHNQHIDEDTEIKPDQIETN